MCTHSTTPSGDLLTSTDIRDALIEACNRTHDEIVSAERNIECG
jgi:hypothetical protein